MLSFSIDKETCLFIVWQYSDCFYFEFHGSLPCDARKTTHLEKYAIHTERTTNS